MTNLYEVRSRIKKNEDFKNDRITGISRSYFTLDSDGKSIVSQSLARLAN